MVNGLVILIFVVVYTVSTFNYHHG